MKNLKKSILMLFLVVFTKTFAQNVPVVQFDVMAKETPVEDLSYQYLLAHKVFLREKPSIKGKRLAVLDIGTKMVLREKSLYTHEVKGIKSHWYKVAVGEKTGWVWGGMIAQKSFGSEADYKVKFVYGYEGVVRNAAGNTQITYQLRAFKDGVQLDKIVLDSLVYVPSEIKNIGNKGLFNVEDIITLALEDSVSGKEMGKSYVFWNNGRFTNVANLVDYVDATYSKTESFVFPSDMEGLRSTIKLKTLITNNKRMPENEMAQTAKKMTYRFYTWNGYALSEKETLKTATTDAVASNTKF